MRTSKKNLDSPGDQGSVLHALSATRLPGVILHGPSGSGRSFLLHSICERLPEGWRAVTITAYPGTRQLAPLIFARQVVDRMRSLETPIRVDPVGRTESDADLMPQDPISLGQWLAAHVRADENGGRVLVLAIEDAQHLPSGTREVISEVSRAAADSVRLLLTSSEEWGSSEFPALRRFRVWPLTPSEQLDFARDQGVRADPAVVHSVGYLCDGHAGSMMRLLERLDGPQLQGSRSLAQIDEWVAADQSRPGTSAPAPEGEERFDSLDEAHHVLLNMLACSRYVPVSTLSVLVEGAWQRLQELRSHGLITLVGRRAAMVSQRQRARRHWGLLPDERRALLHQLAEATPDDADLLHLWYRLRSADDTAGCDSLMQRLIDGLPRALEPADDAHHGEEHLVQALEVMEHVADAVHADGPAVVPWLEAVRLLAVRGHSAAARRYLRMLPETIQEPTSAVTRLRLRLLLEFLEEGHVDLSSAYAAVHLYGDVAPEATLQMLAELCARSLLICQTDDARQLMELSAELPQHDSSAIRLLGWCRTVLQQLIPRAQEQDEPVPASSSTRTITAPTSSPTNAAREAGQDTDGIIELLLRAHSHRLAERWDEARRLCAVALERAGGLELHVESTQYLLIEVELAAGRLYRVRSLLQQLRPHPTSTLRRWQYAYASAWAAASLCDEAVARRILARVFEPMPDWGSSVLFARVQALQGKLLLPTAPHRSYRLLQSARHAVTAAVSPGALRIHTDLIEAALQCGRRAAARSAYEELLSLRAGDGTQWTELAIDRAAAELLTDFEKDAENATARQWRVALDRHLVGPFERAQTHACYARWQLNMGDRDGARHSLEAAVGLFEQAGMVIDQGNLEQYVITSGRLIRESTPGAQTSRGHPLLQRLNDEQVRIVEFVRQGMRNRDIAQTLFLSVRSVELRLTTIYRTLGVQSRRQLISALQQHP